MFLHEKGMQHRKKRIKVMFRAYFIYLIFFGGGMLKNAEHDSTTWLLLKELGSFQILM